MTDDSNIVLKRERDNNTVSNCENCDERAILTAVGSELVFEVISHKR